MEHAMGVDEVKRAICKREILGVALDEAALEICKLKAALRDTDGGIRQIDGSVVSTRAREAFGLTAASAANLKHAQAAGLLEARRQGQAGVYFVAMLVEGSIKIKRSTSLIGEP
jgi:hypothetical protein